MNKYNKIMEWFWLVTGIAIIVFVTIMGAKEGYDRWVFYYALGLLALATYFMRRWMRRRMEKHLRWLEEQRRIEQEKEGQG